MYKTIFSLLILLVLTLTAGQVLANKSSYIDLDIEAQENTSIKYITEEGIVQGFPDGSFKPDSKVTRAEFTKIVVNTFNSDNDQKDLNCFNDIKDSDWFAPFVCFAKSKNIVQGYLDGDFKPAQEISLVEALKIVYEANPDNSKLENSEIWYDSYLKYFAEKNYIPDSINNPFQKITRKELAEIIYRNLKKNSDLDSPDYDDLKTTACLYSNLSITDNVDATKIRQTWLDWSNQVRTNLGLGTLALNNSLNMTATEWSNISKDRGYIDHKRTGQTAYYDYNLITNWFSDFGVEFKNVNSITFTETIGWGYYSCKENSDCTDSVITAIDSTFDFIMNEKGKAHRPHYNSLVNPHFTQLGVGLNLDANKKYYLTVHYGTEVTNTNQDLCSSAKS